MASVGSEVPPVLVVILFLIQSLRSTFSSSFYTPCYGDGSVISEIAQFYCAFDSACPNLKSVLVDGVGFSVPCVGDLTVGKPELCEFQETETVAAAIRMIGDSTDGAITVWKKRSQKTAMENARQKRFVGILNALAIVAFLAREECSADQDKAMNTAVSEVVVANNSALQVVDPGTRLIDALEMMKQGAKRLLVPKNLVWRGMSKQFSILYNGKWLKNAFADPS